MTTKPLGVIDPSKLYTTRACSRDLGLGRELLRKARQEGVKARRLGHENWYSGKELADWILSQPEAEFPGKQVS